MSGQGLDHGLGRLEDGGNGQEAEDDPLPLAEAADVADQDVVKVLNFPSHFSASFYVCMAGGDFWGNL
jgi:hypothetical protein